jgi:hypothetical protein
MGAGPTRCAPMTPSCWRWPTRRTLAPGQGATGPTFDADFLGVDGLHVWGLTR